MTDSAPGAIAPYERTATAAAARRWRTGRPRLLVVGCGDIGLRVAALLRDRWRLLALTSDPARRAELRAAGVVPLVGDLDHPRTLRRLAGLAPRVLHLAPPAPHGAEDRRTAALLRALARGGAGAVRRIVYVGTTGVYGDAGGALVDETRPVRPQTERARRRVDAERRLRAAGRPQRRPARGGTGGTAGRIAGPGAPAVRGRGAGDGAFAAGGCRPCAGAAPATSLRATAGAGPARIGCMGRMGRMAAGRGPVHRPPPPRVTMLRAPGIYALDRPGGDPRERLSRGTPVLVEAEDGYTNHVHADDLARACVAALLRGPAQRALHVSDDGDLKTGDHYDLVARLAGLPPPPRISRAEAATRLTPMQLSFLGESRRLANARMKRELGLRLRYPTVAWAFGEGGAATDRAGSTAVPCTARERRPEGRGGGPQPARADTGGPASGARGG